MIADDILFKEMDGFAGQMQDLARQAEQQYLPVVDDLVRNRSRDIDAIEHALDGLLDFCGSEAILQLYKRLCRYYWEIDPAATASHINAYRDMWDSESRGGAV